MIGAVPGGSVRVPPSIVTRQEPIESREDVGLGPGTELRDDHRRGGMRDEDREQAVGRIDLGQEPRALVGDVDEGRLPPGVERDLSRLQLTVARTSARRRGTARHRRT